MIACFDVHYREDFAQAAAVLLKDWTDTEATKTYVIQTPLAGEYEPGQFYKRELPVLQELLSKIEESLSFLVVDSYVYLGPDRPGLGVYLYEAVDKKIPVIGVAKTHFRAAEAVEVPLLRGESLKPLFITSIGCEAIWAAGSIAEMAGPYRMPDMLKLADQLSKAE
ncbi:MAG: endonuclease V [Bacteroidota bacterium]